MKLSVSVMVVLFSLHALMFCVGVYERGPRTFVGEQSFDSVEEALAFQTSVVTAARDIGADIEKSDLVKLSPPTVSFRVISPALSYSLFGDVPVPFAYGESLISVRGARINNLVALVLMPLLVVGFLYVVWSKRAQSVLEGFQS